MEIVRFEVGLIINEHRSIVAVTNNKVAAISVYEATISKYKYNKSHTIVFVFDYEKNVNINYFDNETDLA